MIEDFCKWIIGILVAANAAQFAVIIRQHLAERKLLKAWLNSVQHHSSALEDDE